MHQHKTPEFVTGKPGMEGPLKVRVFSASNLRDTDWVGKSDPYCVLRIGRSGMPVKKWRKIKEKKKTKVKRNNLNPEWNEDFEFNLSDGHNQTLYIEIKDSEMLGSDEMIGYVECRLDGVTCGFQLQFELDVQWKDKPTKGKIKLGLEGVGFGYFQDDAEWCIKRIKSHQPHTYHGEMKLTIIKATDLKSMDVVGSGDPYVRAILKKTKKGMKKRHKKQKHKTKTKSGKNPEWNQTFTFRIADCEHQFLELHVMDWDRLTKDDAMGLVIVPLHALPRGEKLILDLPIELGKGRLLMEIEANFGNSTLDMTECWKDTVEKSLELAKEVCLEKSKKKSGTFKKLLSAGWTISKFSPIPIVPM